MVTTTEISPCPALQSYVRCYTLREFDTMGADFIKPLPANHEVILSFNLSGALDATGLACTDINPNSGKYITGLQTAYFGSLTYNGNIRFFTIQFRPNGFYQLFNIPPDLITQKIYDSSDVIGGIPAYNECLQEARDSIMLKDCSDEFLLAHLVKSKAIDPYNSITAAATFLFQNPSGVNIKKLAYEANMCLKSFEVKFACQVGLPPKLFARITRFNYALFMKNQNSLMNWTEIAHKCGYYDQMHFIKEFKQFAGDTPVNFYKETPLPDEDYIQTVKY